MTDPQSATRNPRSPGPFAKAPLHLLRRQDLTPAEKIVAIAVERLRHFGDGLTSERLRIESGLSLRSVQRAMRSLGLARPRGRPRKEKNTTPVSHFGGGNTTNNATPVSHFPKASCCTSVSYSYNQERGESNGPTPPVRMEPSKTAGTRRRPRLRPIIRDLGHDDAARALAEALAARQRPRPEDPDAVYAEILRDTQAGRYTLQDLAFWLDQTPVVSTRSWQLKTDLATLVAGADRIGLALTTRRLLADGMTAAVRRGETGPRWLLTSIEIAGEGAWVRTGPGLLKPIRDPPRGTFIWLTEVAAGGKGRQLCIDRLRNLDEWAFEPEQPTLFDVAAGRA